MNTEQKAIYDKAMAGVGLVCSTCTRPVSLENDEIFAAKDGRLWCNKWCMSRPKNVQKAA
jgi:hypothetical protein